MFSLPLEAFAHVPEFPRDCVQRIIELIREGGLEALKERSNRLEALICLSIIVAWALGKLKDATDNHDDGVIFGATPESEANAVLTGELVEVMEQNSELDPMPYTGLIQSVVLRQLLRFALSYLLAIATDSDKLEDIAQAVLDWIAKQLNS